MEMKDIVLSELTRKLLEENGKSDRKNNISMYDGWNEICKEMGFDRGRTPAREAYEDGYYASV